MVIYSAVSRLPLRVLTLLLPVEDATLSAPDVSLERAGGCLSGLLIEGKGEPLTRGAENGSCAALLGL
jgi:hypothetical protein